MGHAARKYTPAEPSSCGCEHIMNNFNEATLPEFGMRGKSQKLCLVKAGEARVQGIYNEGPKDAQVWGIVSVKSDWCYTLWPYRVTQQKVARSWSTQIDLMERYPEHRFSCSSAQQYKWLEQLYPPPFGRVKEKVLEGKFHPVGGSWVENDSNVPSGEALVRQFVFDLESRFGKRCDTAWLRDSFGLTGALPQLIRGSEAVVVIAFPAHPFISFAELVLSTRNNFYGFKDTHYVERV
ncbi:hypothetical protein D9615_009024 [Tricholomella constricta]|uniref:Glycoside hydrolase family 38 N-terminal domain-containing protein n=1 Tax=Tricholomella constricta TaxID=117010 RepID=A0A8H5H0J0_9AGAR|nr:hypothetical protein D9615_009024 [Tricholomella constricta]